MEANSQKRVGIPVQYPIVQLIAILICVIGFGALFSKFKDALIHAVPLLGRPDIAWTLFIGGIVLIIGNQVRMLIYVTRARQRANKFTL